MREAADPGATGGEPSALELEFGRHDRLRGDSLMKATGFIVLFAQTYGA